MVIYHELKIDNKIPLMLVLLRILAIEMEILIAVRDCGLNYVNFRVCQWWSIKKRKQKFTDQVLL